MKILLATTGYPPEHSGSGKRLHHVYGRLKAKNSHISWRVLTKRRSTITENPSGPDSISVIETKSKSAARQGYFTAISEIIAIRRLIGGDLLNDIDLIHIVGSSWYTPFLCSHARKKKIPILRELTTFGDVSRRFSLAGFLARQSLRKADQLIAISPALKEMAEAIGVPGKVWLRPNGVDISNFFPPDAKQRSHSRAFLRKLLCFEENDIIVLSVGRIRPLKNQVFLANVIAKLPAQYKLVIAGPVFSDKDPYVLELCDRISQSDLRGRVAFLKGLRSDVNTLMAGSDLFAFPSRSEGLGNVMLEAACAGLPVVASNLPGVTDWVVRDGENGALSALNTKDFCEAIQRATTLVSKREDLAKKAAKRFDSAIIDNFHQGILENMVGH